MNIKKGTVILLLFVALFAVPIVWLTLQVGESVTFLTQIIILSNLVIANVIIRKTSYKPYQQPHQHRSFYTFKRIQRTIASGVVTTFAIGLTTKSLIQPLLSNHFWGIYLVILFAIGAII
jgi:hypothetical protein